MTKAFHTRQLTFRQLEIFRAVAKHNSVTDAAKALHLAQPTVSTQIARMANHTNFELFEQVGKKLYLTEVGRDILETSRAMFELLDNLEMRLAERAGLDLGHLRISAVTTSKYLVPKWLGSFCREHPAIEPEFNIGNRNEIVNRLLQNLDDLYIFSHPPTEVEIEVHPVTDNPLVLIAPKQHKLVGREDLTWHEVRKERFLMREKGSGTRYAIEEYFKRVGEPLLRPLTIASNEAIKESVAAGLGLAIISREALDHMVHDDVTELKVPGLPIETKWYLVTPKGKVISPVAAAFREHIL